MSTSLFGQLRFWSVCGLRGSRRALQALLTMTKARGSHQNRHPEEPQRGVSKDARLFQIASKPSSSSSAAAVLLSLVSLSTAHADGPIATHGPPVAGVCVFAKDQALQTSKAGASAAEQMRQFASAASAKLKPERDAIAQENQALIDQRANLSPAQLQQRAIALQQKTADFQEVSQQRSAQLQQTQSNAISRILVAINPALATVSAAHHCSLILERGQTYGFNASMDLTAEVIKRVDAALPPFKVELASVPAGPPARK